MYFTFELGKIEAFYYERPEGLPDWSNWGDKPIVGSRKSMGRGAEQMYDERCLTIADWERLKTDPGFGYDETLYSVVMEDA